ncbi:MAG: HNH endonuclease [candidate division Zixibacteria bacterium]|nr:HNH endonuclease [candidate division Zixibacteria bacterium]
MAISKVTRQLLSDRAEGQCECKMSVCSHHSAGVRCPRPLVEGDWEAHHKSRDGGDTLSNLIAMCSECHENTRTYGKP